MNRFGILVGIVLGLCLLAALTFAIAPLISSTMSTNLAKETTAAETTATAEGFDAFQAFISGMRSATQYSFTGTKTISGQPPFNMEISCTVDGGNYAVKTIKDGRTLRQLYVNGVYTMIDDTQLHYCTGVYSIGFFDPHFKDALTGKLIRIKGEILNGNQVNCAELYKDGTIYAFYFNSQGLLLRYYYIYNSDEITIDFTRFALGSTAADAFNVPASYTPCTGKIF